MYNIGEATENHKRSKYIIDQTDLIIFIFLNLRFRARVPEKYMREEEKKITMKNEKSSAFNY